MDAAVIKGCGTLVVAATGHRPEKLGGYRVEVGRRLVQLAVEHLERLTPEHVISGMAQGWDQAVAQAAVRLGIPLVAAVPFAGQSSNWPEASRRRYHALLERAAEVVIVCAGDYRPEAMQIRNEWMVDRCSVLLALWNGSRGGTGHCVRYAEFLTERRSRPLRIINCWNEWLMLNGPVAQQESAVGFDPTSV